MPNQQPFRVPTSVTREQMIEASKPLLDLLGLSVHEIYNLHIGSDWITTTVAARPLDSDEERPSVPNHVAGVEQPHEWSHELAHFIAIQVVTD